MLIMIVNSLTHTLKLTHTHSLTDAHTEQTLSTLSPVLAANCSEGHSIEPVFSSPLQVG